MIKQMVVGICRICRQGELEIVKEKATGKLFIHCDECEADWGNPQDALDRINGSRFQYGLDVEATLEEVKALGWDKYLVKRDAEGHWLG